MTEDYFLDPDYGLPTAYGGCNCECHRYKVSHVMPCCYPDDDMKDWGVEWYPTSKADLEDLDQIDKELEAL